MDANAPTIYCDAAYLRIEVKPVFSGRLKQTHLRRPHPCLLMPSSARCVQRPVLKYYDFENAFESYGSISR